MIYMLHWQGYQHEGLIVLKGLLMATLPLCSPDLNIYEKYINFAIHAK